jgi:hypothetical protein
MSNHHAGNGENYPSEHSRYRLLLEITDQLSQATNLFDAFNKFAPPLLDVTASDLLCLSLLEAHWDTRVRNTGRGRMEAESSRRFL